MNGSTLGVIGLSVVGAVIAVGSIPSGQAPAQSPVDPAVWQQQADAQNWNHSIHWRYAVPAGTSAPGEQVRSLQVMGSDRTGDGRPDPVLYEDVNGDGIGDPRKEPRSVYNRELLPRP